MALTGAALVVRALEDEGIRFAFGIPGTHNIELYDALATSRVRPVLVTDEQSAGFLADGLWRASGQLGCVNLVPGAGLTHALSGIAEAFLDGVPMLVLSCGVRRDRERAYQLHDVDQLAIAAPVTKARFLPQRGEDLYPMIRTACALARSGVPGPVLVEVPVNLYLARHDAEASLGFRPDTAAPASPSEAELDRAIAILSRGDRPPLLHLGLGAAPAGADLVALAERLGSPVTTTFQGKGVFPESHPLFVWNGFGDFAPPFAREAARQCGSALVIGCRFSEVGSGSYGLTLPGPMVQVDIDPAVPGRNFPAELAITADGAHFVRALLDRLNPQSVVLRHSALITRIREGHTEVHRDWDRHRSADRVSPPFFLRRLQEHFGPDTVFTADSGNGTFLAMECLRLNRPGRFLAPVDYSCMGYSVPAAIGARLGCPGSPVVALAGDGAFLMTGLEVLTAANQGIPVAIFVLRDRELAQIAQFQGTAFNRKVASALPDFDTGALAAALGVESLRLERDADVDAVLQRTQRVLEDGRPVVIETEIDYSRKTWFTRGVVKTTLSRLPWPDRLRFIARAAARRVTE
jgi:acetolactate synthase-1/2/3 large subunit